MSLIADLDNIKKQFARIEQKAQRQQRIYFDLISGIVKMHQESRIAKNYEISDALRHLLNSVGVTITQGTAGYDYENIPHSLKGRTIDDTWEIQQ